MKKFKIAFLTAFITLLFGVSSQVLANDEPEDPTNGPTGDQQPPCDLPIWMCGGSDDDEKERY